MYSEHTVSLETNEYVRFWHKACLNIDVMGNTQVSTLEVKSRDTSTFTIPKDVMAFQFFKVSIGTVNICGQRVPLTSDEHSASQVYYFKMSSLDLELLKNRIRPGVPLAEEVV